MKILFVLLALWPGTMLAQGCSDEEKVMQDAAKKLGQCRNKPKEKTPKERYTELWTAATKRHEKEKADLRMKHFDEHQAIVKETGFDPNKEKVENE